MEFIVAIINFMKKLSSMKRKVREGKLLVINYKEVILSTIKSYVITFLISFVIIATIVYSVTYAINDFMANLFNRFNISNTVSTEELYNNLLTLSPEEKAELEEDISLLSIDKLIKYIEIELNSVPKGINGTYVEEEDGQTSSSSVNVDISEISNRYKTPWQLVGGVDILSFRGEDVDDLSVIERAETIKSVFDWNYSLSKDTYNYYKEWIVETKVDSKENNGEPIILNSTENSAKEHYRLTKEPIGYANKVDTMFGLYTYSYDKDVVTKDTPYSEPFIVARELTKEEQVIDGYVDDLNRPIYAEEGVYADFDKFDLKKRFNFSKKSIEVSSEINIGSNIEKNVRYYYKRTEGDYHIFSDKNNTLRVPSNLIQDNLKASNYIEFKGTETRQVGSESVIIGYEQKPVYRTVRYYKTQYKTTRTKIIEDRPNEPQFTFEPRPFISFLNNAGLSVNDLETLLITLEGLSVNNFVVDMIQKIVNGSYGDISDSIGSGGANGNIIYSGNIPLFYQWDSRWASHPYSGRYEGGTYIRETMKEAGCLPTTMAMVINGLLGDVSKIDQNNDGIADPKECAIYSTANGFEHPTMGTSNGFIDHISDASNLTVQYTNNYVDAYNALKKGLPVVCNVRPGTIINGHHFLALTGLDSNGKVYMNDPFLAKNNYIDGDNTKAKVAWDMNTIARESKGYWIITNPNLSRTDKFIASVAPAAIQNYNKYGIFPSVTIAQAALESSWGESDLAVLANNLFGIKADAGWTGEKMLFDTREEINGQSVIVKAYFRVYPSVADSIDNHGLFFQENERYTQFGVFSAKSPEEQIRAIHRAGYATDSNYSDKVLSVIYDYNLKRFDKQ